MFGWFQKSPTFEKASDGPIRVNYGSLAEVSPPAELAALTQSGRHVVLQFVSLPDSVKRALIGRVAAALPEHSVFDSGGDCVTIMPVVARSRVLASDPRPASHQ